MTDGCVPVRTLDASMWAVVLMLPSGGVVDSKGLRLGLVPEAVPDGRNSVMYSLDIELMEHTHLHCPLKRHPGSLTSVHE